MAVPVIKRVAKEGAVCRIIKTISMPSAAFFAMGAAGMCMMEYLGKHLDERSKSNWIEEITNTASQTAILAGLITI